MMKQKLIIAGIFAVALAAAPGRSLAHCDTMDGPVITAAKTALAKGNVAPVLRWVTPEAEAQIKEAFKKTMAVRAKGAASRELADMYFFETLVRLHRAGEGVPYTGLKPAGSGHDPVLENADKALAAGNVDELITKVTSHITSGIRERFTEALEKKAKADQTVEAGREYVEAYVRYIHYVEGIHQAASGVAEPSEEDGVEKLEHGN